MIAKCEDCGKFTAVTYPVWLGVPNYTIDRDVCRRCAEARGLVTAHHPADATSPSEKFVTVPLLPSAPDFQLRWDEMLRRLREADAGADSSQGVDS